MHLLRKIMKKKVSVMHELLLCVQCCSEEGRGLKKGAWREIKGVKRERETPVCSGGSSLMIRTKG